MDTIVAELLVKQRKPYRQIRYIMLGTIMAQIFVKQFAPCVEGGRSGKGWQYYWKLVDINEQVELNYDTLL